MLAFELACTHRGHQEGEPIQWLCWRSGGTDAMCANNCTSKLLPLGLLSQLPSVSHQTKKTGANPTLGGWSLRSQLVKFCDKLCIFNFTVSLWNKTWYLRALDLQPMIEGKGILNNSPSFCLLVFTWTSGSKGKRMREESAPIRSHPHPCGYLQVWHRDSQARSETDTPRMCH